MEKLLIGRWLSDTYGVSPWLVSVFVHPLLVFLLAFFLREIVLRLALRGESEPQRIRLWRRVSFYATVLVGILGVGLLWRASSLDWLFANLQERHRSAEVRDLLSGAIYTVVATAVLIFVLLLLHRGLRHARHKLEEWEAADESLRFQKASLVSRRRLAQTLRLGLKGAAWIATLAALAVYFPLVLGFFPRTAPFAERFVPFVLGPVVRAANTIWGYLPNLVTLVVIVVVARYLLQLLRTGMKAIEKQQITLPGFDPEWADPTFKLARIVVILLAVVVSYPYLPGAGSQVFKGFSLFIGAMITLGSSAAINNIFSGVVLTYTRSFRAGDRVRIGDVQGDIVDKGLFVTRVRALGNEIITIPNGKVLSGDIVNLSQATKEDGLSVRVSAGIGYDTDWRTVHDLMIGAARKTEDIEAEPEPFVLQTALDDYAVSYLLIAKTMEPKRKRRIESELRRNVLEAFHEAGVEIMTPSVSALRDANQPAIPKDFDPAPFEFPGLRVLSVKPEG